MPQPYFVQYRLNNQLIDNPVERFETSIQVNFDEGAQGSIETSQLTFVNQAYSIIQQAIVDGLNGGVGITEGLPLEINIQEGQESTNVFKGYFDFTSLQDLTGDPNHVNEPKVLASIVEQDGLNNLSERLEGLTFALLEAKGVITKANYKKVKYLVEKKVTFLEQAFLALSIYLLAKEIYEASLRLADQIATIASLTATSLTGALGALVYAIASAIFLAVYIGLMVSALLDLIKQFKENLVPSVQEFNGINFRVALNKIFSYLDYEFISPITDLDEYVYLPSKADGRDDKGIPFDSDFGFVAQEFVNLCLNMFRAEIFVKEGQNGQKSTVQMRTKKDPFFESQSTYVLPDVIDKAFSYNLNEIKESRFLKFNSDISDEYTVSNWKGTSVVITTTPLVQNNPKNNLLKGLQEFSFPIALGTAKEKLSDLENAINAFYKIADSVFAIFGNSNTSTPIQGRIQMLIISQPFFGTPKVLKMKGSKLSNDYRTGLSAKYLWDNYHNYDSFVQDNFKRQRKVFTGIRIPFSFSDYKKVIENSYFITSTGQRGKFTSLEWTIESDTAEVSFWLEEVYTRNLQEEITEVE
jgi:hypothetical protein